MNGLDYRGHVIVVDVSPRDGFHECLCAQEARVYFRQITDTKSVSRLSTN
jgi:hypothetical protein